MRNQLKNNNKTDLIIMNNNDIPLEKLSFYMKNSKFNVDTMHADYCKIQNNEKYVLVHFESPIMTAHNKTSSKKEQYSLPKNSKTGMIEMEKVHLDKALKITEAGVDGSSLPIADVTGNFSLLFKIPTPDSRLKAHQKYLDTNGKDGALFLGFADAPYGTGMTKSQLEKKNPDTGKTYWDEFMETEQRFSGLVTVQYMY